MRSGNPDFNLAGQKLEPPYVGRSLMRPLTPPPRFSTPPSLFPASESFEEVPNGLVTGTGVSETSEDVSQGHGKYFFLLLDLNVKSYTLAGTGEFLRNPSIGRNLTGFYIWVGFDSSYERGSYLKRTGYSPPSGRFNGCASNEIVVVVTDHRTSQLQSRNVPLHHLVPAAPQKKGDYVVILSGDYQGRVAEVIQCQRKNRQVKIIIDNQPLTHNFSEICRLTQFV